MNKWISWLLGGIVLGWTLSNSSLAYAATLATNGQQQHQLVGYWGMAGLVLAGVIGTWGWLHQHPANRYPLAIRPTHITSQPPVSPGLAEVLVDRHWPNPAALTGDVMAAVDRGEIEIAATQSTVRLTRTGDVSNTFLQHCFDQLGDADSFTLTALADFSKTDKRGLIGQWFRDWQSQLDAAANAYQDPANNLYRQRLWTFTLGLTGLIGGWLLVAWIIGPPWALATTLASGLLLVFLWGYLVRHATVTPYNASGRQLVANLQALTATLAQPTDQPATDPDDLTRWTQLLPYAVAFGLTLSVTDQLTTNFGPGRLSIELADRYPLYFESHDQQPLATVIQQALTHAIDVSTDGAYLSRKGSGLNGSHAGFGGGQS